MTGGYPWADCATHGYASDMPGYDRIGFFLLIIGYLGVVGGTVAWIVSYSGLELLRDPDIPRGFGHRNGLAGLACWRWTVVCRTAHMSSTMVRGPTRWMAAASLVLAAAPASLTYQIYDNQRQFVHLTQGSHDIRTTGC